MADVERTLGKHEAEIAALQKQIEDLKEVVETQSRAQNEKLDEIRLTLASAKGGWKTLLAVAGFSSVVTGVAMKTVGWLSTKGLL